MHVWMCMRASVATAYVCVASVCACVKCVCMCWVCVHVLWVCVRVRMHVLWVCVCMCRECVCMSCEYVCECVCMYCYCVCMCCECVWVCMHVFQVCVHASVCSFEDLVLISVYKLTHTWFVFLLYLTVCLLRSLQHFITSLFIHTRTHMDTHTCTAWWGLGFGWVSTVSHTLNARDLSWIWALCVLAWSSPLLNWSAS